MKLNVRWLFVACVCGFLLAGLLPFPLRADEPIVRSTTEPYTFRDLTGTRTITTRTYKNYEIEATVISFHDPKDPAANSDHEQVIAYIDNARHALKAAEKDVRVDLKSGLKNRTHANLTWSENGEKVQILCDDIYQTSGYSMTSHLVRRRRGTELISASGFQVVKDPGKATRLRRLTGVQDGEEVWANGSVSGSDETGCADPKFPFELLKEKPL